MLNVTATKNKTIFVIIGVFIHEDKGEVEVSFFLVLTLLSHWFVLSL